MTIRAARVLRFRIPVRQGVAAGGASVREGFLLELVTADGFTGLGEASPASWVGGEPADVTGRSLEDIAAACRESAPTAELVRLVATVPSPAARCAFDTARLDLEARLRGIPLTSLLGGAGEGPVPVAALLSGETAVDIHTAARDAARDGYATLKLKVGGMPPARDRERIEAALEGGRTGLRVDAKPRLRLDANRRWSEAGAEVVLSGLPRQSIEFVEEPLREAEPDRLRRLRDKTGVPVFLDESVRDRSDLARWASAIDGIVLKGCRCGGPGRLLDLAREALERGLAVVVTDSIETSVGASLVVHIAAALPGSPRAVGLGGPRLLAGDVVRHPLVASPAVQPCGPGLGVELDRNGPWTAAHG